MPSKVSKRKAHAADGAVNKKINKAKLLDEEGDRWKEEGDLLLNQAMSSKDEIPHASVSPFLNVYISFPLLL
tara:strand:+ start:225 stop:440 length:216 start_codon:yes stop_codon:yes gene_type:complete